MIQIESKLFCRKSWHVDHVPDTILIDFNRNVRKRYIHRRLFIKLI